MNLNKHFKFISDGTWFLEGSECTVEDGDCLWTNTHEAPDSSWDYEFLVKNQHRISGIFRGPIKGNPDDGEVCGLDEFKIIRRTS